MSTRQNKKRKGRNHVNNRERTVTTFTEDPNTAFLVPLSSEDPPAVLSSPFSPSSFSMNYQNYITPQQQQFFQPVLPPGKNDLEILENLKTIIKDGQHEFYRAVPQPAALASLYVGHIPHPDQLPQDYLTPRFTHDLSVDNTNSPDNTSQPSRPTPLSLAADTSPNKLGADPLNISDSHTLSDPDDSSRITTQGPPVDTKTDATGDHAPRPPPELRHYEPSYGSDYVPPPRRHDPDDKRGALRSASLDDRSKPPPLDDRKPPLDDRRPPPPATADDRRLTLDDRSIRPLPASDARALLPPSSEDRARPVGDSMPLTRATTEDDRGARGTSLAADDRPRANVPLEERLSQAAATPSLQDRLSQPVPVVVPARVDIASAPSLEERLSLGPVPPRVYARAASVARDDLRAPPPKDDLRDHDRVTDFRTNRDFSRERFIASTYRPDPDRGFGDRDDRDRRNRDVAGVDAPPARFGDTFSRVGPPRRYSPPPPMFDRDRERERGRVYYPTRSPPPFRGEAVYDPDGERRYTTDRERDTYEQRRRDWYAPSDDDKRGPVPPPPASWRPHERLPFMDRDRERFDRERERDRDVRERDRERERNRDLGGLAPPPPRGHWDDRDRRGGFPLSPPLSQMDTAGSVGPGRSLSARLTDSYPLPSSGSDERAYPPPREFDRGRYGGPALDDHAHAHAHAHGPPLSFSRVRNRSPSPPRRGPGLADDMRPPMKRVREDNGPGYLGGGGGGAAYSPPRRGVGGPVGEYAPGPPPSSGATTTSVVTSVSGTIPPRSTGTRTPPVSAPPPSSGASRCIL
ncbi:hypothetical protein J3R83DRAFT_3750 [Lanmaoa asiatica]|nr:hypothetical protein J3R83DRAFT_3750 [Lanmaoa asiatica]